LATRSNNARERALQTNLAPCAAYRDAGHKAGGKTKLPGRLMSQEGQLKTVMLVLASHNTEVYKNARRVWKSYARRDPNIDVFFVYGQLPEPLPDRDESDLVYEDIPESYNPGMLRKTVRAIEELHARCTYDYFIRTNISTFWNFPELQRHLAVLPRSNCYSGDGPLAGQRWGVCEYLSGTDTIVTPEMIAGLIAAKDELRYDIPEDAAMGVYFHGQFGAPFLPNRIHFMERFESDAPYTSLSLRDEIAASIREGVALGRDHYRVKP